MRSLSRVWPVRTALLAACLAGGHAAAADTTPPPTTAPATTVATPAASATPAATTTPTAAPTVTVPAPPSHGEPPRAGLIRDPAPRPMPALRVQARYAQKARQVVLFGGVEYLSRGDYYINPGARVGLGYYILEPLALELQVSHYWSSLNGEAARIKDNFGLIPDSHAPEWLGLVGARYSIGYGKLMVGGFGKAIHFEPQAFLHVGGHAYDGDVGFSSDAGLGLLIFLTPHAFTRVDVSLVFEREERSGKAISIWGALPALSVGGLL
jgi:hypothetical protein